MNNLNCRETSMTAMPDLQASSHIKCPLACATVTLSVEVCPWPHSSQPLLTTSSPLHLFTNIKFSIDWDKEARSPTTWLHLLSHGDCQYRTLSHICLLCPTLTVVRQELHVYWALNVHWLGIDSGLKGSVNLCTLGPERIRKWVLGGK